MLERCTETAVCGREYIRVEKLTEWMRSVQPGSRMTHAERLLYTVYQSESKHSPSPPVSSKALYHHEDGCLLVFSILLELGRGNLVARFRRLGIIDKQLPIDSSTLQNSLKNLKVKELPDPEELADRFNQLQWRFSAVKFNLDMDQEVPDNRVIPIRKMKRINRKGGTAEVWRIDVFEEFVGEDLREAVKSSVFFDNDAQCNVRSLPLLSSRPEPVRGTFNGPTNYRAVLQIRFEILPRGAQKFVREREESIPWPTGS
jgi:hypothetical protein